MSSTTDASANGSSLDAATGQPADSSSGIVNFFGGFSQGLIDLINAAEGTGLITIGPAPTPTPQPAPAPSLADTTLGGVPLKTIALVGVALVGTLVVVRLARR